MLARLIYGFRLSLLFGLTLAGVSSVIGIAAGAVQGYFGGWIDLVVQRFIEIWSSLPHLYLLIIISSIITPSFFVLLGILLLFSWVNLVHVVRAEFLRTRNFEYVNAARALGLSNATIILKHVLPNATVATLTFLPFMLNGSITTLTSLDFLGFGLPPGSPSLGELLLQGKSNLPAPWLGLTGFFVIALMLSLLVFIGEAVRDAFDPQKDVLRERTARPSSTSRPFGRVSRRRRAQTVVDRVSFRLEKGRALALVGKSGSGKTVTALAIVRLLPQPAASYPTRRGLFRGEDLLKMSDARIRAIRGATITMVFQEPMTSLNPLHTIERQIGEILALHHGRAARDESAHRRASDRGRHRRSRRAARRLSASAFRRPAPARDDRHGARQPPRSPDRRRADDRARRHRAGADPRAAQGPAGQARHGDAVHHPRPQHRATHRRRGRRDAAGTNRRSRPDGARLRRSAPSLHAALLAAEPKGDAPPADRSRADRRRARKTSASGFRSSAASCAARSATSRRSTASRSRCARARRSGSSANPARARRRSASRCCG